MGDLRPLITSDSLTNVGEGFKPSEIYVWKCEEPVLLWWTYSQAVESRELWDSFRWKEPPKTLRFGERVWRVFDTTHPRWEIGWFSLRLDPVDPTVAYLVRAVYPKARRRGYRVLIGEEATRIAKAMGVEWLMLEILDSNSEHLARQHAEAANGGPWQPAGMMSRPFLSYFFARDLRE